MSDDQRLAQNAATRQKRSTGTTRRIMQAMRDGWVGPPRPGIAAAVLLVACIVLAAGGFLRRGGMDPAQGTVFAGFALTFLGDFVGTGRQRLVLALRVIGTVIALLGIGLTFLAGS